MQGAVLQMSTARSFTTLVRSANPWQKDFAELSRSEPGIRQGAATDRAERAERAKSFFATDLRGSTRIGPRRPVAQGSSAAACERPLQIEGPCRAWCFRWPQPDPCKSAQSAQIRGKKTLPNSVEANRGFVKEPQRIEQKGQKGRRAFLPRIYADPRGSGRGGLWPKAHPRQPAKGHSRSKAHAGRGASDVHSQILHDARQICKSVAKRLCRTQSKRTGDSSRSRNG